MTTEAKTAHRNRHSSLMNLIFLFAGGYMVFAPIGAEFLMRGGELIYPAYLAFLATFFIPAYALAWIGALVLSVVTGKASKTYFERAFAVTLILAALLEKGMLSAMAT